MDEARLVSVMAPPLMFGLVCFVEPCSVGSTVLVLDHIESDSTRAKILQTAMFAATPSGGRRLARRTGILMRSFRSHAGVALRRSAPEQLP